MHGEPGESRCFELGGSVGEGPEWTEWVQIRVGHLDYPRWVFKMTIYKGVIVGFDVETDGSAPLTARALRSLPFREIEHFVRGRSGSNQDARGELLRSTDLNERLAAANLSPQPRDTPQKWDEVELARLCAEYVVLLDTPAPVKTLADLYFLSAKRIRNLLAGARMTGLLTAAPMAGRPGGALTERAKELLRGDNQEA